MKMGNIRLKERDATWETIKMGLLAQQYAINLVDSLSYTSLYDNKGVLINVEELREDFKLAYTNNSRKANKSFHPAMRQMGDEECDDKDIIEVAK